MSTHLNGDGPEHDPVESNRATNPRRTPGRAELGVDVTRRVTIAAMVVVAGATAILIAILSSTS
ncbi:MAG TPA: hypothetical protein VNU01_07990 [Egibacteraceae bacterium]|nr:hypothetical protein [Egibacteraceae bacterium]